MTSDKAFSWLSDALDALPEQAANDVREWAALRLAVKSGDDDAKPNMLIGLTAALGVTVQSSMPNNQRIGETVKSLIDEMIRDRNAIFLPPDLPDADSPPTPQVPAIFLPPDPGTGGGQVCPMCKKPLP